MYYPILRGKQYELLALRELAAQNANLGESIYPIIEPVRTSSEGLLRSAQVLSDQKVGYGVVLNPSRGDFMLPTNQLSIPLFLSLFSDFDIKPRPVFIVDSNYTQVFNLIERFELSDVMILFEESLDSEKAKSLLDSARVSIIIAPEVARSDRRVIRESGKEVILLEDKFVERRPNTAYRGIEEDYYTESFYYYGEDHYYGYADYCCLPKSYSPGGSTPKAIAIHLSYKKKNDNLWVKHFVSDPEYDAVILRNKYQSAIGKVAQFYGSVEQTPAVKELLAMSNHFPGLGVLKKITIRNHIEVVCELHGKSDND